MDDLALSIRIHAHNLACIVNASPVCASGGVRLNWRELRFGEARELRAKVTALANLCKDFHHGSV